MLPGFSKISNSELEHLKNHTRDPKLNQKFRHRQKGVFAPCQQAPTLQGMESNGTIQGKESTCFWGGACVSFPFVSWHSAMVAKWWFRLWFTDQNARGLKPKCCHLATVRSPLCSRGTVAWLYVLTQTSYKSGIWEKNLIDLQILPTVNIIYIPICRSYG